MKRGIGKTSHKLVFKDARRLDLIASGEVDLVVTSPPYPMIKMWDDVFSKLNPAINKALSSQQSMQAFELMHRELDKTWDEIDRVLTQGGIACINIGDATRSIGGQFQLFSNHSRILSHFIKRGFLVLPEILWRKQTNAPNKFMGSGMLPTGAYVTLEHEYVLILRKGGKRDFTRNEEKAARQESSFFWEERNTWFSDLWDIKGTRQKTSKAQSRQRSAAYPFELAHRLINMFSVKGDTVLDPFLGTGTTTLAAIASGRNSIGVEIDNTFAPLIRKRIGEIVETANTYTRNRLHQHCSFAAERMKNKGALKHTNAVYHFPVMTAQETQLFLQDVKQVIPLSDTHFEATYSLSPQKYCESRASPIHHARLKSGEIKIPPQITDSGKFREKQHAPSLKNFSTSQKKLPELT